MSPISTSVDKCPYAAQLAALTQRNEIIMEEISEIKADIKAIRASLEIAKAVQLEQAYHKESMARAFSRLEKLEGKQATVDAYLYKLEGMKTMAYVLWTILSSGIFVLILRSFGFF